MRDAAMPEHWLAIEGYEGLYEVSDQGNVRSLDRTVTLKNGRSRRLRGRLLKQAVLSGEPYAFVGLHRGGVQMVRKVHNLVAEAFIGPRPEGWQTLHGPGGQLDNRVSNLSYGTVSQNCYDRRRDGTDFYVNKTHCIRNHQLVSPNLLRSGLQQGHRDCLACSRGSSRVNNYRSRYGIELDLQATCDEYYERIMAGLAPQRAAPRR